MPLTEIRPKVILQHIEERLPDRNTMLHILTPPSGIGGLTLLETALLVSLARLIDARRIFEFGTYLGATTLAFAGNTPDDTEITTVDLPRAEADVPVAILNDEHLRDGTVNDDYLRASVARQGALYLDRADPRVRRKVRQLQLDSRALAVEPMGLAGQFDLIFIDGGHDYAIVKSDTAKALEMAGRDALIVWHDYGSQIHSDVSTYVNEFSHEHDVVHVQNTMLAIHCLGNSLWVTR